MKSKTVLIVAIVVLLVVGVVVFVDYSNKSQNQNNTANTTTPMVTPTTATSPSPTDMATPSVPQPSGDYVAYAPDKLLPNGTNIIFFAAKWCPSCNALDQDINANRQAIPPGVRILKADYDQETQLKQQYKITIQHMLVQVDGSGREQARWHGLYQITTLEDLISKIQKP